MGLVGLVLLGTLRLCISHFLVVLGQLGGGGSRSSSKCQMLQRVCFGADRARTTSVFRFALRFGRDRLTSTSSQASRESGQRAENRE
jgi:hypothetical protein